MPTIRERRTRKGEVRYEVQVRLAGEVPKTARFKKLKDAKRWAQEEEVRVRERRRFGRVISGSTTLADAIDRYIADKLPELAESDQPRRKALLLAWHDRIGHVRVADLRPDHLSRVVSELAEGRSPATLNHYLSAISRVLTFAQREWGLLERNPARDVARKREPPGRVRYLSAEERDRLFAACEASADAELWPLVVLALSTGARRGELLALRWESVDLERGVVTFEHTKNRERRSASISEPVRLALARLGPKPSGPIFARQNHRTAWDRALSDAGIQNFRFHDLRHTAASWLAMNGASLLEVATLLGHKTLAMVRRYAHLSQPHLATVANSMADKYLMPSLLQRDPPTSDSD